MPFLSITFDEDVWLEHYALNLQKKKAMYERCLMAMLNNLFFILFWIKFFVKTSK